MLKALSQSFVLETLNVRSQVVLNNNEGLITWKGKKRTRERETFWLWNCMFKAHLLLNSIKLELCFLIWRLSWAVESLACKFRATRMARKSYDEKWKESLVRFLSFKTFEILLKWTSLKIKTASFALETKCSRIHWDKFHSTQSLRQNSWHKILETKFIEYSNRTVLWFN